MLEIYEKNSKSGNSVFVLEVDGTKSFTDLVMEGKYGLVNPKITPEHYPFTNTYKRVLEIELFNFDFDPIIYSKNALERIHEKKFRPIKIEELLALGAKATDLQFSVLALGSVHEFELRPYSPVLRINGSRRELDLYHTRLGWAPSEDAYRCGAVRL